MALHERSRCQALADLDTCMILVQHKHASAGGARETLLHGTHQG